MDLFIAEEEKKYLKDVELAAKGKSGRVTPVIALHHPAPRSPLAPHTSPSGIRLADAPRTDRLRHGGSQFQSHRSHRP